MKKTEITTTIAHDTSDLEKTLALCDSIFEQACNSMNTAFRSHILIVGIAEKYHIASSVICKRYDWDRNHYNKLKKGASYLLTGEFKKGKPVLKNSPFAITENGKTKDFSILVLARLASLGDDNAVKEFLKAKNITPDTAQAKVIKALSDYKKELKGETEAAETETETASATETAETTETPTETITEIETLFVNTFKNLETIRDLCKDDKNKKAIYQICTVLADIAKTENFEISVPVTEIEEAEAEE